ncbi:MAG: hypothetical protein ACK5W1_02715 [Flavobacteriales bacterium]|jgi:hypothetical protein
MICSTPEQFRHEINSGRRLSWRKGRSALKGVLLGQLSGQELADWNHIAARASVFLHSDYLTGLASQLPEGDRFWHCLFYKDGSACGIAVFHLTTFRANKSQTLNDDCVFTDLLRKSLTGNRTEANVMICGNAFATGEHGFLFLPHISASESMEGICTVLSDIIDRERKHGKKISAVVAKDFYPRNKSVVKALEKCGFRDFEVDPNMILPIQPEWNVLEDYLESMSTKFRTKANAAMNRSSSLTIRSISSEEFRGNSEHFYALYLQVASRAEYQLGILTRQAFIAVKENLKERMIIRGYYLGDQLVGFLTAFDCGDRLDAHMVGIDYEFNKSHSIYSSMLYEYVRLGIQMRKKWVMFGRTAGEIKTTIGAFPVRLSCCIRHPGKISNLLLNWLFAYVKPNAFPVRQPWKKHIHSELLRRIDEGPFCC